ncbi:MAG: radical SAM protein, partial [Planctomycetota bacterium]
MHLTLHLTKDCNLRCTYCFAAPFTRHAMSQAVGERALEFGAELGNGECNVIFFGGEPLLCKERIRALIAHARQLEAASANGAGDDGKPTRRRFSFRISTNGTLLDDETLAYFMRENVHVALSIDGCREAHDTHRRTTGGEGTFDTVVERLAALLAVRPYSPVQMVVRPDTVKYVTQSVEFLLDEGVRYLLMSLDYTADWTEAHMRVLEREYRKLARRYIRWTEAGRKFYFSPFEQKLASHIHNGCTRTDRCEMARQQLSVDIDGYNFPCVQFPNAGADSEYCRGSIFTGL